MSDLGWVVIALISLIGIVVAMQRLLGRSQTPNGSPSNARGARNSSRVKAYPAVGIRYNLLACRAVQKYYDQRFLARDAPTLPVPGCTVRPCPCRYVHYSDRRAGEERRAQYGIHRSMNTNLSSERRRSNERRQTPALA